MKEHRWFCIVGYNIATDPSPPTLDFSCMPDFLFVAINDEINDM